MFASNGLPPPANIHAPLLLPSFPRYNLIVLCVRIHARLAFAALSAVAAFGAAGCVAPLGPGYAIQSQRLRVQFVAAPHPRFPIAAEYQSINTGHQPLGELELHPAGRRRDHIIASCTNSS